MKSDKKSILIFTDWYLPGYKAGGPITSCANLVAQLGDEFRFRVLCGDRDYLETTPYPNIEPNEWQQVGKAQVMYLSAERQNLAEIKKIIKAVQPDIAYVNGMFSKVFTLFPLLALRRSKTKAVVAPRGMLAPAALAIKSTKKKVFLNLAKLSGLFKKVRFHATNHVESRQIAAWFGDVPIAVVENIPSTQSSNNLRVDHKKPRNKLRLYSVARIAPEKNILFALECLLGVDPEIALDLDLIGPIYDQDYWAACQQVIKKLPPHVAVHFLGTIPGRDIPAIAAKADFFYLPTAGENYGHAIVEALLMGIPVLISTKTPWRDLEGTSLGFDLDLEKDKFTKKLNEIGRLTNEDYLTCYKKIKFNAGALVNLNKLQDGYKELFNDRNRS